MKALAKRARVVGLLMMLLATPMAVAALEDCAGSINAGWGTGFLVGQHTETTVIETRWSSYGGEFTRFGFAGGGNRTITRIVTYNVGTYQMADGSTIHVRCDTLQQV